MPGIYRPRHPERTVLYRVLFHHFERFVAEYESRFERDYGYFRPIVKEVVERYLDCGNPRCGFARIRCPRCRAEHLLMFSCKTRGFCPSCHAKRLEEWGEWMRETLLLDVPHRQVVFTIPKMLRLFFKFKRRLLGDLCRCAERVGKYMIRPVLALERLSFLEPEGKVGYRWGQERAGQEMMDYPEFIARVTSHIPDKGQVTVRYYGLYANAHRGKVRKAGLIPFLLRMAEEEVRRIPSKGWAEMIRIPHDVDGQSAAWRAPAGDATGPAGELAAGRHRYGLFVAIYSWLQNCQRHTASHPEAGFRAALSSSPGFGPWEVWKE